jgi:hypothetical protein
MGQKGRQTDDAPNRSAANTGELASSFAVAKQITVDALSQSARTFPAQTESGRYNGRIIGETAHHIVQVLSSKTAVAHTKHLLGHLPVQATKSRLPIRRITPRFGISVGASTLWKSAASPGHRMHPRRRAHTHASPAGAQLRPQPGGDPTGLWPVLVL